MPEVSSSSDARFIVSWNDLEIHEMYFVFNFDQDDLDDWETTQTAKYVKILKIGREVKKLIR